MSLRILCLAILLTSSWVVPAPSPAATADGTDATDASAAPSSAAPPALIIGFTGGFVRHDNMAHGPVQFAEKLRRDFPTGTYVQMFENRHGEQARAEILKRLGADHGGNPSPEDKQHARLVLFGHSWGATQAIVLARELEKDGVPVLLTIQIDSVLKPGHNDSIIPANVAAAVNFYQTTGLLHGQTEIRAADPARTQIIGNYKYDYATHPLGCYATYPWLDRVFMKAHTEIECDPSVWDKVEALIRSKLP